MRRTHRFAALAGASVASAASAQLASLTTAPPNNGISASTGGIFFDLTPDRSIVVESLDYYSNSPVGTATRLNIYTAPGSYVGWDTTFAHWTLATSGESVSAGPLVTTPLQFQSGVSLQAGETMAFFVSAASGGMRYTGTDFTAPQTLWSNGEATLFSDLARDQQFGGTAFTPRCFSGTIWYRSDGCLLIDGFETFGLIPYTVVAGTPNAVVSPDSKWQGALGVRFGPAADPAWYVRTDWQTGPGAAYWALVRHTSGQAARVQLGVGAGKVGGAISAVYAPDEQEVQLQDNTGFGSLVLAATPAELSADVWYRLEIEWRADGRFVARVLDAPGATIVAETAPVAAEAPGTGVALRGQADPLVPGATASLDAIAGCGAVGTTCPAMENAGFETNSLTPWTVELTPNGASISPITAVVDIDVGGVLPATPAARFQVGKATTTGEPGGITLTQSRLLGPGQRYTVSANVLSTSGASSNADGGTFELVIDGRQVIDAVTIGPVGIFARAPAVLSGEFSAGSTARHTVGVRVTRNFAPSTINPIFQYVDNVLLLCGAGCDCVCNYDISTGADACDFFDFVAFQDMFSAGDDCGCDLDTSTGAGVCDFFDFISFQDAFSAGC